jgi:hypothetical protein
LDQQAIEVMIIPRADLKQNEAIHLGKVIQTFLQDNGGSESIWSAISRSGLADLLAGELPKPLGLVMTSGYRALCSMINLIDESPKAITCQTLPNWLRKRFSPLDLDTRAIFLELAASPNSPDNGDIVQSLVNALPRTLLDSVFVAAVSRRRECVPVVFDD